MKLLYKAEIIDEDTDEVLAKVSSYSLEGLEEEMGKRKFAVKCNTCGMNITGNMEKDCKEHLVT